MNKIPSTIYAFLQHFIKRQKKEFSIMMVCVSCWAINESFYPYFMKILINNIEKLSPGQAHPFQRLAYPLISLFVCWMLMELSMRIVSFISMSAWPEFRKNIREDVWIYTQGHSHRYFSNNFSGNISNKISELPRACHEIIEILIYNFFGVLLTFALSLILFFRTNVMFGFILLGWFSLFTFVTLLFLKIMNKASKDHAESVAVLNGQIVDSLTNISTIRLFSRFNFEIKYLSSFQNQEINLSKQVSWLTQKLDIYRGLISALFMIGVFIFLVYSWNLRKITLGDFSLIALTSFNIMGLIWHCAIQLPHVIKELGVSQAALDLINKPHELQDLPEAVPLKVTKGKIQFEQVTFRYHNNKKIFQDKNLVIKPGEKIGLVGFSGSGKSTFVNLILRFYDLQSGRILIDDQDIQRVTQESLRSQISMIPQDPVLFHRTLYENISYGRLEASQDEVIEAARRAGCLHFIHQLSDGFQSMVGERGLNLSGGQRQRIVIARAFIKNAPILILDEATSSLDSSSEQIIQDSLCDLMKNKTCLIIAHRLSTLKDVDRILVFSEGKIVEDGPMSDLIANEKYFHRLWQLQSEGFLPENDQ